MKLGGGAVIQGFCAENTAVVVFLLLGDLNVLEHKGHRAAGRIILLFFKIFQCSCCGLALQMIQWKLQVQISGTYFFSKDNSAGIGVEYEI